MPLSATSQVLPTQHRQLRTSQFPDPPADRPTPAVDTVGSNERLCRRSTHGTGARPALNAPWAMSCGVDIQGCRAECVS
jgi:hypothetical protein